MIKEVCYRVNDGMVLAIKPQGSVWSTLERGAFEGATLKVKQVEITADEHSCFTSGVLYESGVSYSCRLFYLNETVNVVKESN